MYANHFHCLIHSVPDNKKKSVLIFTISDINFAQKTVFGHLVAKEGMKLVKARLPSVVFNASRPLCRADRKKVRLLAELPGMTLLNETNQFRQSMLMDILRAAPLSASILPRHRAYRHGRDTAELARHDGLLLLPEKGFRPARVIWLRPPAGEADGGVTPRIDLSSLQGRHSAYVLKGKRCIALSMPEPLMRRRCPVVFTLYVQRGAGGRFEALPSAVPPGPAGAADPLSKTLPAAAVEAAEHMARFIPSLTFCTVFFVSDVSGVPYIIHLQGWDSALPAMRQDSDFKSRFAKNLFDFSHYITTKKKGGIDFVD